MLSLGILLHGNIGIQTQVMCESSLSGNIKLTTVLPRHKLVNDVS